MITYEVIWMIAEKRCNKEEKMRFAITIGVLAGVALLTISVTFIRKMDEQTRNGFFSFTNYYKIAGICVLILIY